MTRKPATKFLCRVLICAFIGLLPGCISKHPGLEIAVAETANPWTHLNLHNDPEDFQFVIVSDRTGGYRPEVFTEAVEKINLLRPEFVICVGDSIEGYAEQEDEIDRQWDEFDAEVRKLQMPFFFVAGNHDISNQTMLDRWKQRFGKPYYHFVYRNVLFLCLDSEGDARTYQKNHISDEQIAYFRDVLLRNHRVRWTLVFVHKPFWEKENPGWLEFEKLLSGRNYTVFAGHEHQYAINLRNGRKYIRLATTGGTSSLDGTTVGTFDHIVWVTMTQDGPMIANLLLDGIYDENVTTFATAQSAKFLKNKVDRGQVIKCEPITVEDADFAAGSTKMTIRNFASVPMKITGAFKENPFVTAVPAAIELTVPPLLTETVDIQVSSRGPTAAKNLQPLDFEAVITYTFDGKTPVQTRVPVRITFSKPPNR